MNYIEIAQGSPRNRGSLILKKDLLKYINPSVPLFRSVYLYDKEAVEYAVDRTLNPHEHGILFTDKSANQGVNRARRFINQKASKLGQYYDAYIKKNPYARTAIEESKKYKPFKRKINRTTNPVGIAAKAAGPFIAAMLSPLKAGEGSTVVDPKTGINKYTGEKEYTPFRKGGRRLYKKGGPKPEVESPVEAVPVPVTVSPAEIYLYLTEERGLSANHALGMINNIQHESSFVFGVEGDDVGKMSSGLFQHRGGRRDKLIKHTEGNWATDWRGQIDFALSENDTKKYLKQTFNTPAEASSWFTLNFEKPRDKKVKAVSRLETLPGIMDAITMPIIYPNLKPEVTITPETQS